MPLRRMQVAAAGWLRRPVPRPEICCDGEHSRAISASARRCRAPAGRSLEPDIGLADEILFGQLVRPSFDGDSPDLQEVGAIHQFQHLPHILLDD
jgi:hypothetical protein